MIVIVGAGLAGLSTAYHLRDLPYKVFEKEGEVGGLCRSYSKDGFTFDYTGHLLHFRQPAIKTLVENLLQGSLQRHNRRSFIYSHETFTEYPFQVNTYGLPPEVVRECLLGFIETLVQDSALPEGHPPPTFKEWIVGNLGAGMAKHFMIPFNEKLWQVPLDELTSDWVSWLVPKPNVKDVVNGALGIKDKAFGYNPTFLYPAQGGIEALPKAFLRVVSELSFYNELIEVDTVSRQACFQSGEVMDYNALVSTMPVPELVKRCKGLPQDVYQAAAGLRCVSVYNLNLGVARAEVSDKHWIYFPEKSLPFYRAGFPMNFSPSLGPSGCSSLYVELSHHPTEQVEQSKLVRQVRDGLEHVGIFQPKEKLVVEDLRDIRYAYVLYDQHRSKVLPNIFSELEKRGIYSVGRYGRWEHTSMEDAIAQGKQLGERLWDMYQDPSVSAAS